MSHQNANPAKRLVISLLTLVLCVAIIPALAYPLGPESHAGLAGAIVSAIPLGICLWSFLSTQAKPIQAKIAILVLFGISFAFAFQVISRYIAFGLSR